MGETVITEGKNGKIEGSFNVTRLLILHTTNSPINVSLNAHSNLPKKPAVVSLKTTNGLVYHLTYRSSPQLTRRHPQSPPIQHLTLYQLFLGHWRTFPRLHSHKQRGPERLILREPTKLTPSPSWIHEKRTSACGTRPSIRGWLPPPDHAVPPHAACDTWREGPDWPRASTQGK